MISGLVLYLNRDTAVWSDTLAALEAQKGIAVGRRHESRLPIVVESSDGSNARDLTQWILDLPGVDHLDVTYVDLEEGTLGESGDG